MSVKEKNFKVVPFYTGFMTPEKKYTKFKEVRFYCIGNLRKIYWNVLGSSQGLMIRQTPMPKKSKNIWKWTVHFQK
jgi:hypothetical protein